jgi:hypothetical protein
VSNLLERPQVGIVVSTDDCIEWDPSVDAKGYGIIPIRDSPGRWHNERAHRAVWVEVHGPIPDGLSVLHRCDNPPCINVEHLFLGTHTDNMRDMVQKGRGRTPDTSGDNNCFAKLSRQQALAIRDACDLGVPRLRLADEYNVGYETVRRIAKRLTWRSLPATTPPQAPVEEKRK